MMNIHVYIHNTAYIVHQDESSAIFKTAKLCLSAYVLSPISVGTAFKVYMLKLLYQLKIMISTELKTVFSFLFSYPQS